MLKSLSGDTKVTLSHCTAFIHCFYSFDSKLKFWLFFFEDTVGRKKNWKKQNRKALNPSCCFFFLTSGQSPKWLGCANKPKVPHLRGYNFHADGTKVVLDVPVARCALSGTAAAKRFSESLMTLCRCQKLGCRLSLSLRTDPLIQSHLSAPLSSYPTLTLNVCLPDHFSRLSLRRCLSNALLTWEICASLPSQRQARATQPWHFACCMRRSAGTLCINLQWTFIKAASHTLLL